MSKSHLSSDPTKAGETREKEHRDEGLEHWLGAAVLWLP